MLRKHNLFFFSSRRRHTRWPRDWGSDVCSSDLYLDEQRRSAALVGLDPAEVPGSVAEMSRYLAAMRPELARTEDADVIYRFLHRPPVSGAMALGMRVYEPVVGHLGYSLLPSWAVGLYGR